ncbi:hypothetical protein GCM10009645_13900 [Mycolicibacterium poriferae]|uniref:Uncharacterized protein n=1 Tax=Mycolicibacterium poriferae TaxID=39694 RepID=A0A6N4V9R3_9MYCO|nr:hypothetical protein [Mycolicibacterium poriferae]BBX52502.1 hypothetical protein MPOR_35280 [Mycolicibacterium poriferae]
MLAPLTPLTPLVMFLVGIIDSGGEATVHEALAELSGRQTGQRRRPFVTASETLWGSGRVCRF